MAIQEIPDLRGFSHLTDLLYLYCHHYHLSVIEVPDNSQSGTNLGKVVPSVVMHPTPPTREGYFYQQTGPFEVVNFISFSVFLLFFSGFS
jgi:hypothetical protein